MVAKVTFPGSIKKALNYNEQKVKEGKAECISLNGFLKETDQLNFYAKLERFEKLNELNKRAKTNTLHVSLNFHPSEKLTKEQMVEIARTYMEKIGFGDQPYIVYVHNDAGHPHIHIVTTAIQKDGKRMSMHNIGRDKSEPARKEIEKLFDLVKAEDQRKIKSIKVEPGNVQKVRYGKTETKRAMTNVLSEVIGMYKFTSLEELNAILKLYNVVAERGREDGVMYKNGGLVFRVLDEKGHKAGVPIKASSIFNKPTLKNLEKLFTQNAELRLPHKKSLRTRIDWILTNPPKTLEELQRALQKEKIILVIRKNEEGRVYGLTYIDHNSKCVFNGSDLGKGYAAKAILEKLSAGKARSTTEQKEEKKLKEEVITQQHLPKELKEIVQQISKTKELEIRLPQAITDIIKPADELNYVPSQLKRKRKKKR